MNRWILILSFIVMNKLHAVSIVVFVSFSMPNNLLKETLTEAAFLKIPVVLNGLHQNSMQATALKLLKLTAEVPNLNLQIDPTQFEHFGIVQVPAVVAYDGNVFDVIYGNLSIK